MLTGPAAKWQRLGEVYLGHKAGRGAKPRRGTGGGKTDEKRRGGRESGKKRGIEKGKED